MSSSSNLEKMKAMVGRYHDQILKGCGQEACKNEHCASSGKLPKMTSEQAAAEALRYLTKRAPLCQPQPAQQSDSTLLNTAVNSSERSTLVNKSDHQSTPFSDREIDDLSQKVPIEEPMNIVVTTYDEDCGSTSVQVESAPPRDEVMSTPSNTEFDSDDTICEARVQEYMSACETTEDWTPVRRWLGRVLADMDILLRSFSRADGSADLESARSCFAALLSREDAFHYLPTVISAVERLCSNVESELRYQDLYARNPAVVDVMLIVMELPIMQEMEFLNSTLGPFCRMFANLPTPAKTRLVQVWSSLGSDWLLHRVQTIQQAITLRILHRAESMGARWSLRRLSEVDDVLPATIRLLSLLHRAALLGGQKNQPFVLRFDRNSDEAQVGEKMQEADLYPKVSTAGESSKISEDELESLSPWDVRQPLVAYEEFQNDTLCEYLNIEEDFIAYKNRYAHSDQVGDSFSVLPEHAFIVTPAIKLQFLFYENRIRMQSERRQALINAFDMGVRPDPYLRLRVNRADVIKEALDVLGATALTDPDAFKKQLRVEFEGEQGVDEGGVSKEFYQLVTDELFNPDYGMFVFSEDTRLYWFNPGCTYCRNEYRLIGILFGLAIYNHVLVDVHFPLVLYRKLFGRRAVFADLRQLDPVLYNSLLELLNYPDDDLEDVFSFTFRISYKDVYGNDVSELLLPDGDQIFVTKENRHEFVDRYVDFLLNRSIHDQFESFAQGFRMVADQSMLTRLCLPEEVEQLVCGVSDLDFAELQRCTRYENGFEGSSPTVGFFWEVVHGMSDEDKKRLLTFTTGCDRAPIGGLAKLDFIIARNGDDCTRLPTAHTCFNVLLLPEYKSIENLRERLMKAITYSRGFGLQ